MASITDKMSKALVSDSVGRTVSKIKSQDKPRMVVVNDDLMYTEREYVPKILLYITGLARFIALTTAFICWVFTIYMFERMDEYGTHAWYSLALAIVVTLLEVNWIINKCMMKCKHNEQNPHCCVKCWRFLNLIDTWVKGVIYLGLAIPCFLYELIDQYTITEGVFLLICSVLYFLKSFQDCVFIERKEFTHQMVQTSQPEFNTVAHSVQTGLEEGNFSYTSYNTFDNDLENLPEIVAEKNNEK